MFRHLTLSFAVALLLIAPRPANAQRAGPPIGFVAQQPSSANAHLLAFQSPGGMPRWVKWGLVGAVAGGVLFAVVGQSDVDRGHSVAGDAFLGAATGFVILGGAVAFYDWVCGGDTRSRRSGLCGG
jgi:hypothetical protein